MMKGNMEKKIAVQIDFDGTVTVEDVSFLLLDTFVGPVWRKHLEDYSSGDITVGAFNKKVFGMMKVSRNTMLDFIFDSPHVKIRPGFKELVEYCKKQGYKAVIVSNGLTFYIDALLKVQHIKGVEIHAAQNTFFNGGMEVKYLGPDGKEVDAGFKEVYVKDFINKGYDVIYIGNGTSDIYAARLAKTVFACDDLLKDCLKEKLAHYPFKDFFEVIKVLGSLHL